MKNKTEILTCVYCGQEYPKGTPPHGSQILTDHIKVCENHPLRKAEADCAKLRKALVGLVSCETAQELDAMEAIVRLMPAPDVDKIATINAITALRDTLPINPQPVD